jgi:hypothetical protein
MKTIQKLAAVFLVSTLYATSATAGLIVNGGFETGDSIGWTVTDDPEEFNFVGDATDTAYVPFGQYTYFIGCTALCSTSQVINTTAGQSYTFSFEYGSDPEQPNEFEVFFDGISLFASSNSVSTPPSFNHKSFEVTGTGGPNTVEFRASNLTGYLALDNISVEESRAIPEPESLALLLAGLAAFGLNFRKKK